MQNNSEHTHVYLFVCTNSLHFKNLHHPTVAQRVKISTERERERGREWTPNMAGTQAECMCSCVFSFCLCFTCCCHSRRRAKVIEIARRNWKRARTTTQELASFSRTHHKIDIMRHYKVIRLRAKGLSRLVGQIILSIPRSPNSPPPAAARERTLQCESESECAIRMAFPQQFLALCLFFVYLFVY